MGQVKGHELDLLDQIPPHDGLLNPFRLFLRDLFLLPLQIFNGSFLVRHLGRQLFSETMINWINMWN